MPIPLDPGVPGTLKEVVSVRRRAYKLLIPVYLSLLLLLMIPVCLFLFNYRHVLFPHPHREELKTACERYLKTVREAELTLDTSRFSEVTTGELLESSVSRIEERKANNVLASREFEIVSFRVLDYNPPSATIEVGENSRFFRQDPETGERDYGPTPDRWICTTFRVTLVQEEGTWKVQYLDDIIEWGPCDAPENWTPPAWAAPTVQTKGTPLPE
jgi:hypothetical protein